ncbi:uncharacterized protein LOC136746745 [Amia ocellicauda]|uniref:uncharacterized protein LOC136746745 n=1 Tax=Amia ocellicauda TaxID=2972642 RepID=UPI003463CEAA
MRRALLAVLALWAAGSARAVDDHPESTWIGPQSRPQLSSSLSLSLSPSPSPSLSPSLSLSLSTVKLCIEDHPCQSCVRARVQLRARVLPRRMTIDFLIMDENRPWTVAVRYRNSSVQWVDYTPPFRSSEWKTLHSPLKRQHTPRTWELTYDCLEAREGQQVMATVDTGQTNQTQNATVERIQTGSMFNVSVDRHARSVTVSMSPGQVLRTRLCYKVNNLLCDDLPSPVSELVDFSQTPNVTLRLPHLLPCLCVEVYPDEGDHVRGINCPLQDWPWDTGDGDVWRSSTVTLLGRAPGSSALSLEWSSVCPLRPNASLCWRDGGSAGGPCRALDNAELQQQDSVYSVSGVDRHPRMCVQFFYKGSHHVECPFGSADTDWTVQVTPASSHVSVRITASSSLPSSVPASFSAVVCRPEGDVCVPVMPIHTASLDPDSRQTALNLTAGSVTVGLCVQVWRSDVQFSARRLVCPYGSQRRLGLVAMVAFIVMFSVAMLLFLGYRGIRWGLPGWLWQHRPVLLVSSSDWGPQVAAECALASLLQGELRCEVRLARWALGALARLGPMPWLYKQREEVGAAGGRVLIAWSPEARELYESWREEGGVDRERRGRMEKEEESDGSQRMGRGGKRGERSRSGAEAGGGGERERGRRKRRWRRGKKEEGTSGDGEKETRREGRGREEEALGRAGERKRVNREEKEQAGREGESLEGRGREHRRNSVTGVVLSAALACLHSELAEGGGAGGFVLVYFEGLGHSRDIPERLRALPRYKLPRDFAGLVGELNRAGGGRGGEGVRRGSGCWLCWTLLSKILALRLARQLGKWLGPQEESGEGQRSPGSPAEPLEEREELTISCPC